MAVSNPMVPDSMSKQTPVEQIKLKRSPPRLTLQFDSKDLPNQQRFWTRKVYDLISNAH